MAESALEKIKKSIFKKLKENMKNIWKSKESK